MKLSDLEELQQLLTAPYYNTLHHSVLDTGDVAEFKIQLDLNHQFFKLIAFVNVEIPEGQTASDVEAQYLNHGVLDFAKFTQANGPLNFVARTHLEYEDKFPQFLTKHFSNQEDFISLFSDEENAFITSILIDTYNSIVKLRDFGVHQDVVNSFLNSDYESTDLDLYEDEIHAAILPCLGLSWMTSRPIVDIDRVNLIDAEKVYVSFSIKPKTNTNFIADHFLAIESTCVLNVDYKAEKLTLLELEEADVSFNEYDDEVHMHFAMNFPNWLQDQHQIGVDNLMLKIDELNHFVTQFVGSDQVMEQMALELFKGK